MPSSTSTRPKAKKAPPKNFAGDLNEIAREIVAASEQVLSKRSQTRDHILEIKDHLLTAHGNGLSLARMAAMLAARGLKCSAPTLGEILGLRKKKPEKNCDEEGGKSGRKIERSGAENGAKNGGKSPPEIAENRVSSQASNEASGGKVPAFKSRGEL